MRFQDLEVRSPHLFLPRNGQSLLEDAKAEIRNLYDIYVSKFLLIKLLELVVFVKKKMYFFKN